MTFKSLIAASSLLVAQMLVPGAYALDTGFQFPPPGKIAADTFGKTLPPIGYVEFCSKGESECKFKASSTQRLAITPETWNQVQQVNNYVNAKIKPKTDNAIYGKTDVWTYPTDVGDCEDYVLLKKRYLEQLGFNSADLPITVVLDENGEGHAVLTVISDKGDFVLDNRRDEIMLWNVTGYKFLKRQSQEQAVQWVSLQNRQTKAQGGEVSVSTKVK